MGMMIAPAVHVTRKSVYTPSFIDNAITDCVRASRGVPQVLPIFVDGKVIGLTAWDWKTDTVIYKPITHRQWCGFYGYDDIVGNSIAAGRYYRAYFIRDMSAFAVGSTWADTFPCGGAPDSGAYTGSASTARQFDNNTSGGLYMGPIPGSGTKHIISWSNTAITVAGNPVVVTGFIYDRVLTYESVPWQTSTTTMTNTLAAQRYISNGDPGLLIMPNVQTTTGATTGSLSSLHYTDNGGNTAQLIPTTEALPLNIGASGPSATAPAFQAITNNASNGGNTPFVPLLGGDTGVRKIEDLASSSNNTGTICWSLVKPLGMIWTKGTGIQLQMDLTKSLYSLERVYDAACVNICIITGSVNTSRISGYIDVAWGG